MTVKVVRVERRRDGRLHPAGGYHTPEEIELATGLIHAMRHRGMSFRAITVALPERGLCISLGSVWHYWATTECAQCAEIPPEPAPRPVKAEVVPWR